MSPLLLASSWDVMTSQEHTALTSTWHAVNVKNRGSAWLNHPALVSPPEDAHLECLTAKSNSVVCSNPRSVPRFMLSCHRPHHTPFMPKQKWSHTGKSSLCTGAQGEGAFSDLLDLSTNHYIKLWDSVGAGWGGTSRPQTSTCSTNTTDQNRETTIRPGSRYKI